MRRKKTTVYLDPELLRAVKVLAASTGRHDYEIVEDALRQYLSAPQAQANRECLRASIQTDRVALGAPTAQLGAA